MTVRAGREFLAVPGPTNIPDEVLQAMHRPAVEIYSEPLIALTDGLLRDLGKVFATATRPYIYIANGHGAWEAALTNVLVARRQDFGPGKRPIRHRMGRCRGAARRRGRSPRGRLAARRAAGGCRSPPARRQAAIKAILAVQIETSTGVANDIAAIGAAIKAARHDALYMVDAVASLGCMPFAMDAWGVDVAVSGSQKGLMSPPGLSFVAAGERAREAHRKAGLRTPYWDWTTRDGESHYQKYSGTPPEQLLFALRKALDMLFEEGLDNVFLRHRLLAEAVRRAVAVWKTGNVIDFNVVEPGDRSDAVTTVLTNGYDPKLLRAYCDTKCGVVLGHGIGKLSGKAFRIAHMGHLNAPMVLGTLGVIEMALGALGVAHGKGGVQAAVEWLSESVKP